MVRSLLILFYFVAFIASSLWGRTLLYINNTIYLSLTDREAYYFDPNRVCYVNVHNSPVAGKIKYSSTIMTIGNRKIILRHPILVYKKIPFLSYDDLRMIFPNSKLLFKKFIILEPFTDNSNCETERLPEDLSFLKRFARRRSPITIVIDPGHGGEDSGARGPWCHLEKDLVLRIASLVVEYLAKNTNYRILLTRYGDYYIPLKDRSALANKLNADIFVSIHANAAPRPTASGLETFVLALNPLDEEAKHVAALENKWAKETGEFKGDIGVKRIVNDLLQNRITRNSALLASAIQREILNETHEINRGIRKANFWVLLGTKMPSTLIEVGFISNSQEEKKLFSLSNQKRIAEGIAKGIIKFLENRGSKNEIRRKKKGSNKGN